MKPNRVRHENQTQKEESKIVRKSEGSVGVVVYVFFFLWKTSWFKQEISLD